MGLRNPFRPMQIPSCTLSVSLVGVSHDVSPQARALPTDRPTFCHLDYSKRDYSGIILHVNIFKKATARCRLCTTLFPWNCLSSVLVLLLIQVLWLCRLFFASECLLACRCNRSKFFSSTANLGQPCNIFPADHFVATQKERDGSKHAPTATFLPWF